MNDTWAREKARELCQDFCFDGICKVTDDCGCMRDLASALLAAKLAGWRKGREDAAKIAQEFPDVILQMWERPGGPPGNGVRSITGRDIAVSIRAMPDPAPGETT